MGKKKRKFPQVEEVLARPWCYYCERDFDDLKILISHQKAKHFKCDRCGRRLNTAGGLSVHMNQVHKENLSHVENALPNRKGLDIEIFGMEGVPEDVIQQHQQRVLQEFYEAQKERQIATGNPPAGSGKSVQPKKPRLESSNELKARLREWLAKKAAGQTGSDLVPMDTDPQMHPLNAGGATLSPSQTQSPLPLVNILEHLNHSSLLIDTQGNAYPPPEQYPQTWGNAGQVPPYQQPYAPQYPGQVIPSADTPPGVLPFTGGPSNNLSARPPYPPGYLQQPPTGHPSVQPSANVFDPNIAASVGDLISSTARAAQQKASSNTPTQEKGVEKVSEKKKKKDNIRLIFSDNHILNQEEEVAQLPRYAFSK